MIPNLILADTKGRIFEHPFLKMMGMDLGAFVRLDSDELIVLPKGSSFLYLPKHTAIGWDEKKKTPVEVRQLNGKEVCPVAAFLIPGFTRTFLPAAVKMNRNFILPLWPYTAAGYNSGKFYAAAIMIDRSRRQRPCYYSDLHLLKKQVASFAKRFRNNRLVRHLSFCALTYNCRNAQNFFLKRWEAPLPVSPSCNARCLGCLSYQESDCSASSHERIHFVPQAREVFQAGVFHLSEGRQPMVSFGQGCEGEPLLQSEIIVESIVLMRKATKKGKIHLNTNGFSPSRLKKLVDCGLDSVRFSLNSFNERRYLAYYRPKGYVFEDVLDSVRIAKKAGLFVSVNLLTIPGLTDTEEEIEATVKFLKKGYVDLLQLRNLSIDPGFLARHIPLSKSNAMGIMSFVDILREQCPEVRLGYFNPLTNLYC